VCRRRTEEQSNRTEVANWNKLIDQNGYHGLREKGQLRLEGKEYIVQDGDVLVIRHERSASGPASRFQVKTKPPLLPLWHHVSEFGSSLHAQMQF
jgi:hypothetical protein